jgi:hypothetical protein
LTEEPKKKMGLGKGCLIAVGVIVGLGVIGQLAGGGSNAPAPQAGSSEKAAEAAAPAAPDAVEVSAKQLSAAFQENEVKAKMGYDGKALKVTGVVKDITLDFADDPVVQLAGANDTHDMGISQKGKVTNVAINGLSKEQAAKIDKGSSITVICQSVDEVMGGAQLKDCAMSPVVK